MTSTTRVRRSRRLLAGLLLLAPLGLVSASSALSVQLTPVKADPDINEYLPSASGDWVGWTANSSRHPGDPNAYVQQPGHGRVRLNPAGTYGEAGGFDGSTFVWTQWRDGTAGDLWRINLTTGNRVRFPNSVNTPYGEFLPSLSGKWLLFTRYNWDINRYGVILFNRELGAQSIMATGTRNRPVWSAQANGDWIVWERYDGDASHVIRYHIPTGSKLRMPQARPWAYAPSVAADGTVFYATSGNACGADVTLHRYTGTAPSEVVRKLASGVDVFNTYVDDRLDDRREVLVDRVSCSRNTSRWRDIYKFVDSYTLTAAKAGAGSGTVTSDLPGINCGSDCSEPFPRGTTVTLTAAPGLGSEVAGWSVPACGTETQCAVEILGNQTVTVTFSPILP